MPSKSGAAESMAKLDVQQAVLSSFYAVHDSSKSASAIAAILDKRRGDRDAMVESEFVELCGKLKGKYGDDPIGLWRQAASLTAVASTADAMLVPVYSTAIAGKANGSGGDGQAAEAETAEGDDSDSVDIMDGADDGEAVDIADDLGKGHEEAAAKEEAEEEEEEVAVEEEEEAMEEEEEAEQDEDEDDDEEVVSNSDEESDEGFDGDQTVGAETATSMSGARPHNMDYIPTRWP